MAITDKGDLFIAMITAYMRDKELLDPFYGYTIACPPFGGALKAPVIVFPVIPVRKPLTLHFLAPKNDQRREDHPNAAHTLESSDPFTLFNILLESHMVGGLTNDEMVTANALADAHFVGIEEAFGGGISQLLDLKSIEKKVDISHCSAIYTAIIDDV